MNVFALRLVVPDEILVVASAAVRPRRDAAKAVQVELTAEAFVLRLVEVGRHDARHEFFVIVDLERRSRLIPRYHAFKSVLRRIA